MSVNTGEPAAVAVPADLTPAALHDFHHRLSGALERAATSVALDCGGLRHVTSAYVNVFWSAYERCAQTGVAVRLEAPPPGLIRTLQIMDLAHFFGLGESDGPSPGPAERSELVATAGVYTDRFRPDTEGIEAALARFGGFLARAIGSETLEFELRTIFYEVATNIRLHARTDLTVDALFNATVADEHVVLSFRYTGLEFDPTQAGAELDFLAAARRGQTRGLGLAMLHRMTDRLSYGREEGGWNVLTIEKKRRATS